MGAVKIVMMTLFPAYFLVALPADFIHQWNWLSLVELTMFTVLTFDLAWIVFYRGLKKYESGNLINVKT